MKKRWGTLLVVLLLAVTSSISAAVVLASGEDGNSSALDKLSSRVAAILGLDEAVVDEAIKQARSELKEEAMTAKVTDYQAKLTDLVESGKLTQEQAADKLETFQLELADAFASKKKAGSKDGTLQEKLAALVEKGTLTQEQADDKLKWLLAKKAKIAESSYLRKTAVFDPILIQEKLAALVEKGALTQEQADQKLKWLSTKTAGNAESS